MPSVVMYVLSSQTRGSKSLGSATDANVNMYRNPKDSVVCGMKGCAPGTQMEPPIPTFSSIPSCESSNNIQLVCASCSQAQTVISTSTYCLLTGVGCCSSTGAFAFTVGAGHLLTSQKELCISQKRYAIL